MSGLYTTCEQRKAVDCASQLPPPFLFWGFSVMRCFSLSSFVVIV